MKTFYLVLLLFMFKTGVAQTHNSEYITSEFIKSFNSNDIEKSFSLLSNDFKKDNILESSKRMLRDMRSQLGKVISVNKIDSPLLDVFRFRLQFEKPIVDIVLAVDKNFIIGIAQESSTDTISSTRDNFWIETQFGNINGTLLLPKVNVPCPVVLLIAGSGPTDRNMNQSASVKTNSFLLLAEELAKRGIASVRFDKRGVGSSRINQPVSEIVFETYIHDANAFIGKMKLDSRFSQVFVLGHSEGAAIGLLSSLSTLPAGFISVSGYANDFGSLLEEQFKKLLTVQDFVLFKNLLTRLRSGDDISAVKLPSALAGIFNPGTLTYLKSTMQYNSLKEIKKLKIPILLVGGSSDAQVPFKNAQELHKANPKSRLILIEGMNHVLKDVGNDILLNQKSYSDTQISLSPQLVNIIVKFLADHK